jgi:hypothetical protein
MREGLSGAIVATKAARRGTGYFNGYRLGAWATHGASWLTTYWLCEWVGQPATDAGYAIVVAVALIIEFFILHKMKNLLFDDQAHNDGVGWAGFIIDAIVNAGGAFPRMGRLAAWPPLAALVGAFGLDTTQGSGNTILAFVLALAGGIILSVLPIRLDQAAAEQDRRTTDS